MDFMPEEQTLLTVVQVVDVGNPPKMAACLAGACPTPAESTLPKIASSTFLLSNDIDCRADLMQCPPSCGPVMADNLPMYEPIGVLLAATI